MYWNNIIGQNNIINTLKGAIISSRIPQSQLFIGNTGFGSLAIATAFACEILYNENKYNKYKIDKFLHLDLHFCFPIIKNNQYEFDSNFFISKWKQFIQKNIYFSLNDWYTFINADNEQGIINIQEIEKILSKISLTSVEGGSKIVIFWMVEKMNDTALSKLLKPLEEPPKNTYFILVGEDENQILPTIISRCQVIKIPPIKNEEIYKELTKNYKYSEEKKQLLIHKSIGNWNILLKLVDTIDQNKIFATYFILWVRFSFQAKKNLTVLKKLYDLSIILSGMGKEEQKKFLLYALEIFRQAMMSHYSIDSLIYMKLSQNDFKWEVFAKYINNISIHSISEELSKAIFYIERNANSKILFLNVLFSLIKCFK